MNVVVYGATGNAGSRIVKELVARGHKVTGVARKVDSLKGQPGVTAKADDLSNVDAIAAVIKGADAVVTAYQPPADNTDALIDVTKREVAAVKKAGVPRLLMVGGAGLLEVAPGVTLIKSGHLPAQWMPIATSHEKALDVLRGSDINWTYLSPAAFFEPGERTGKFRLGTKELISNEKGESRISMEDYAIALADELERPRHERGSFSVGWA
ncbi:3-beta hydroxysteroid dehydrogenase [Edaphobacter acidisoli]|uniref:3-beta hydroxysteroid dehydrogenase n=1 Tax=Edaphobacter acidisoli TaxID=2040573 RepID=A0A916S1J6_9BACT|nr:NAD(P)H-binding protein [Edaphobacter acidisoli]GGA77400.1 3-beta hydroxysteroid dehydrogenase [Edaphobacter acidisoli]